MASSGNYSDSARRFLWDVSGAFGDIGVLFPLSAALIARNGFDPTALFLTAGIFYAASAWYFRITMPVQPLKAMAAIAVASGLGHAVINAAGIVMGVILICLAVTGLSDRLGGYFPVPVIRGIQLGLGAMLVKSSLVLMRADFALALAAGAVLAVSMVMKRNVPPLIPLLLLGAALSLNRIGPQSVGLALPSPAFPDAESFRTGFLVLVPPQLALTFGNAIVATEATGRLLYGGRAEKLTLRSIPLSMGAANIFSGFMGGAPLCHGSGGLTAHSKFGATSRRSGYIIGCALIACALFLGRSAVAAVSAFPQGILGVLLCSVGLQHALFVKDALSDGKSAFVAFITGTLGFASGNLTAGFLAGLAVHYGWSGIRKIARA